MARRILVHHADGATAALRHPPAGVAIYRCPPGRICFIADRCAGPSRARIGAGHAVRERRRFVAGGNHRRIDDVESVERPTDIESKRMELRGVVRLAGEVIAQYWPMRTFVHHNPLHSLEYLPFEETVRRGKQFMGGNGYLPSYQYREYYAAGRIRPEDLDAALKSLVRESQILIGARKLTHAEVLRACLIEGLCDPIVEPLDSELPDDSSDLIDSFAKKLSLVMPLRDLSKRIDAIVQGDVADLGRWLTLSHWCDDTLGTKMVGQINDQMIKWCEAFL